jgi:hypothetical protein
MSVKSTLWHVVPEPIRRRIDQRLATFNSWREGRPFWGGALLILAGIVIGYVPLQFATELAVIGGAQSVIGLIFAVLVFLDGVFVLARPEVSTIFGVIGIALSILSIIGALGGLFVGMLLGIAGGNLCIAWQDPDPSRSSSGSKSSMGGSSNEDVQFSWQGDQ